MPTINETLLAAVTGDTIPTKTDVAAEAAAAVAGGIGAKLPAKPRAAKPASSKRTVTLRAGKPATSKPANAKPAKPGNVPSNAKPAKPAAGLTRTAATIVAQRTNFGELSDRDAAYLAFFAGFAKRAAGGVVRLADIVASGKRPTYNGSSKPHDAGVCVRLTKAGFIAPRDGGNAFVFTERGKSRREYIGAKAA